MIFPMGGYSFDWNPYLKPRDQGSSWDGPYKPNFAAGAGESLRAGHGTNFLALPGFASGLALLRS